MDSYDIVIIGAGASGMQLAVALGEDPDFQHQKIALLEKDSKEINDRTWCFWEKGAGQFDDIIYRNWDSIRLAGPGLDKTQSLAPYRYKMLRALDFYKSMALRLEKCKNVHRLNCAVKNLEETATEVIVTTDTHSLSASRVFTSVYFDSPSGKTYPYPPGKLRHPVLLQHFLGWVIRVKEPVFDSGTPTFMDFDLPQLGNTRFMYILPFSEQEALVEYTLFSRELLSPEEYVAGLKDYLNQKLGIQKFEILEKETGCIPMTVADFASHNTDRIYHIGVAGGWAKPSTGYTFYRTSLWVPRIVSALKTKSKIPVPSHDRFWHYDRLLLEVLYRNNHRGAELFTGMFKNLDATFVMKFLGEETNVFEDMRVITSCPPAPFIRAFWNGLLAAFRK